MSDYDSDRDIENEIGNMNMDNDTDKIGRIDKETKRKRDEAKRRAMEERRKREDPEKARKRQRRFDDQMGGETGMGPSALLKF